MTDVALQAGLLHSIADERLREELLRYLQLEFQRAVVHHQMHVVVIDEILAGLLLENLDCGIILMLSGLLLTSLAPGSTVLSFF